MEPQRYLCLRFPNWPMQAHLRRSSTQPQHPEPPNPTPPIALHTPLPNDPAFPTPLDPDSVRDLQLLRSTFPATKSGPAIIAVNKAAWNQGVRPGLPLAEARSLATPVIPPNKRTTTKNTPPQPVHFIPWLPAQDRLDLIDLSEPLRRFAPVVGLDTLPLPDSLLLNVTGCGPLFGDESGLLKELVTSLQQSRLYPRTAIADSIAAAWALTHTDQASSGLLKILPPNCGTHPLEPLPVAAARLNPNDLEILQHLGIHRIGQLLQLPIEDLPARLSAECVLRIRQLRGDIPEFITPLPESSPVAASWAGDDPAQGIRDLQWILTKLCENLTPQLESRRLACHALLCEFFTPDRQPLSLHAGLVKPERSPTLLADVLSLRLEFLVTQALRKITPKPSGKPPAQPGQTPDPSQQLTVPPSDRASENTSQHTTENTTENTDHIASHPRPLPPLDFADLASLPISAVRLTAISGPPPASRQRKLFADDDQQHSDAAESLAALLSRLSGRLGPESVLTAALQADPRPEFSTRTTPVVSTTDQPNAQNFHDLLEKLAGPAPHKPLPGSPHPRPLRLLPEPLEVSLHWEHSTQPSSHSPHRASLNFAGKRWTLENWTGPERIQTAWWTNHESNRDYYFAAATTGSRFWLFRDLLSGRWFLHGVAD